MSTIRNFISNCTLYIVHCKLSQFHIPNFTFLILLFLCTLPPLSAQSPNYNIGDVITNPDGSKGVVFWLSPDGSGGWMCALNDVSGTFAWSTQSVIVSGFPALATPSTYTWEAYATVTADTAGYSHTQLLRAAGTSSTYPAAYAVDFAHGWYLPAIGQLLELYAQQPTILSALTANGGNEISRTNSYWSSTYATNSNGYYLYNPRGYWSTTSKSTAYYVRPVRSFSTRTMVYDTTLTYQWSNGATTPYTNVSPTSSRSYTVTATSGFGCTNTAEVSVVVGNGGSQTIYDTICAGSGAYSLNGFNLSAAQTASAGDTICTTTLSEGSCSTTVTLRLHRKSPAIATLNAAICPGECYYLNGMELCNAGTYTQRLTAANGCDSVLTLHLGIFPPLDTVRFNETICQGEPFTGHGFDIPADSTTTPHVIVETVHAPSLRTDCDSITILTLTVLPTSVSEFNAITCNSYIWNETTYEHSGDYVQHLENTQGCDSVVTLHLTVNRDTTVYYNDVVCQGNAYSGYGFDIPADSTIYPHTIVQTVHAPSLRTDCDSITILTLTVLPTSVSEFNAITCNSYIWNETTYEHSGDYVQHLDNTQGCDSVVTLHLTVNRDTTVYYNDVVCQGNAYSGYGFDIPADSTIYPYTIVQTVRAPSLRTGCDSITILTLTVNPVDTVYFNETICQGETYAGHGFDIPTDSTMTPHVIVETGRAPSLRTGCDSITILTLTVLPTSVSEFNAITCNSYIWNETDYDQSGDYVQHLENTQGCDSVVTLHLTVNRDTAVYYNGVVCQGNAYSGYGFDIPADSTIYPHTIVQTVRAPSLRTGCDSITILTLTVNPVDTVRFNETICQGEHYAGHGFDIPADSTIYPHTIVQTVRAPSLRTGCDSITILTLTVHPHTYSTVTDTALLPLMPHHYNGYVFHNDTTNCQLVISNHLGCDSIITYSLYVKRFKLATADSTVCSDALPIIWNGIQFTQPATRICTLVAHNGIDSILTMTLHVNPSPQIAANLMHVNCHGTSTGSVNAVVSQGAQPYLYQWMQGTTSIGTTAQIANRPAGAYHLHVTDAAGCTADSTFTIQTLHTQLQAGAIAQTQVVCEGDDIALLTGTAASGGDNGHYEWQTSENGTDFMAVSGTGSTQDFQPEEIIGLRHYRRAWISTSCGTAYSNIVTITVNPILYDTVTATVCQNEPYNGQGFDISAEATNAPGIIVQTGRAPSLRTGCDSVTTLLLTVHPTYHFDEELTLCDYDLPFSFRGSTFEPGTPSHSITDFTYPTIDGCDSVYTLDLTIIETDLQIESLNDFCDEVQADLRVETTLQNYIWNTGETTDQIHILHSGDYAVTASTGSCEATATIQVPFCEITLHLPNAITPSNHDGLNDYFCIPERIQKLMADDAFNIYIYNRWGEEVFHSTDKNFKWDGSYKGETYHNNIYEYVVRYKNHNDRPFLVKGSITVL